MSTNGDGDLNNGENINNNDVDMQSANRIRIYPDTHNGPFYVYIRATKGEPLKHIKLSKHLFTAYGNEKISRVVQMNNHKIRVELKIAAAANELTADQNPLFSTYRVYIAAEQVEIDGVIRFSCDEPVK